MKLAAKLAQIMATVDRIPKNGRNDFHRYNYATEADVAEHVRSKLAEQKIIMITDVEGCERLDRLDKNGKSVNDITRARVRFTFYDGDSEETISFVIYGDGQDAVDKGIYKAITGAEKYALMKTFLIPTGDDPENDSGQNGKGKSETSKEPPKSSSNDIVGNTSIASASQIKSIFTQAKKNGWEDEDVEKHVFVAHALKLTRKENDPISITVLNQILAHVQNNKPLPGDDDIPF